VRRVRRWLWDGAAAVSLVLCALACVMWARSFLIYDTVSFRRGDSDTSFTSLRGRLVLSRISGMPQAPDSRRGWRSSHDPARTGRWRSNRPRSRTDSLTFGARDTVIYVSSSSAAVVPRPYRVLWGPYWSAVLAASLLPSWRALRSPRARRQLRRGRCAACGYDLCATPRRCPECGKATAR
jgi:hypothetical protein